MVDISAIQADMKVIGADGVAVGTVDRLDGDRIKLTKRERGAHAGHHHYVSTGLVSGIDGDTVRLSANADVAVLIFEEEKDG